MNTTLIELVREDIHTFLRSNQELFFNERDFQMHLALYLKSLARYDDVDLEYYVPNKTLSGYVWDSELRMDIVIRKGEEYLPIELKYKTKSVAKKTLPRFGEDINATEGETFEIMKSQGAQDLGMYDFWKDVRRLELVRNRYEHVVGGLAVFLTNDPFYTKPTKESSNNYKFGMQNGTHSCDKHWQRKTSTTEGRDGFDLDSECTIQWQDITTDGVDMHYCIVTIEDAKPFNVKVVGKTQNATALGIAKAFVMKNPRATLADLRKAFPNDIAPDKGVPEMFLPLAEAEVYNANMSLYFTKDERPIQLQDGNTVAMAQIWTSKSLQNLIEIAAPLGIEAEVNKDATVDFGKEGYALEIIQN